MTDRQLVIKVAVERGRVAGCVFTEDAIPPIGKPRNPHIGYFVLMAEVAIDVIKQAENDRLSKSSRSSK